MLGLGRSTAAASELRLTCRPLLACAGAERGAEPTEGDGGPAESNRTLESGTVTFLYKPRVSTENRHLHRTHRMSGLPPAACLPRPPRPPRDACRSAWTKPAAWRTCSAFTSSWSRSPPKARPASSSSAKNACPKRHTRCVGREHGHEEPFQSRRWRLLVCRHGSASTSVCSFSSLQRMFGFVAAVDSSPVKLAQVGSLVKCMGSKSAGDAKRTAECL